MQTSSKLYRSITAIETFDRIVSAVCRAFRISEDELWGKCRIVELVWPRWIAVALLRGCGMDVMTIERLSGYDHTVIAYSLRQFRNTLEVYPDKQLDVERVRKEMRE